MIMVMDNASIVVDLGLLGGSGMINVVFFSPCGASRNVSKQRFKTIYPPFGEGTHLSGVGSHLSTKNRGFPPELQQKVPTCYENLLDTLLSALSNITQL